MTKRNEIKFPLLFDGGMGTYYPGKSNKALPECEMANIFDSETILEIHKEYVDAGAMAIKTNTFQANKVALSTDLEIVEKVIKSGIKLAKEAVGDKNVLIFADIGQIGPEGTVDISEYKEIVDVFIGEGITDFLFETYSSLDHIPELAKYIKERVSDAYIIASFAIMTDGQTRSGEIGENLIKEACNVENVDAVGFNCVSGPLHLREYLERIYVPECDISIMPNAGYPTVINGRTFYSNNKEYFSNATLKLLDYGANIIGGCCGTTPEFTREIAKKLPDYTYKRTTKAHTKTHRLEMPHTENLFRNKLENGKRPIAVEYDPPQDLNMAKYIENAKLLDKAGADAITIADCPVARARVDASLTAYKLKNEVGIDPIVHMTCRDRNINATKALLLGLNIENILNTILITGDPIPTAERDEVKSVFQFNSVKLANFIREMNESVFSNPINIGGALNVNATNFDAELRKAKQKEENGVNVFYTQPVISHVAVENIKRAREELSAYIMGGIMPVVSHKNAVFMDSEISGINVEKAVIDRYEGVDKDTANKLAVEIAYDFSTKIKDYIDGYYIITPFNRVDLVNKLIEKIKENQN